ncbi:MAG: serine hydrolase domain-containing protein [Bacteroidales bacterium]|nr:serine hydrolase domain-containing protein [Bacteroidales bacterium]
MRTLRILIVLLPLIILTSNWNLNQAARNQLKAPVSDGLPNEAILPFDKLNEFNSQVSSIIDRSRINGNVLVAYKGKVILCESRGFADFSNRQELNSTSPFQLASVSKSFTSLSIIMLQERGLIDYDDLVNQYIPEFPFKTITIRHLLNHTSGMPNYFYLAERYWDKSKNLTNEDVLQLLIKHKTPLNFTPGRSFNYSNTGYAMLALLVEKVSHVPFNRFLNDSVFKPLGMKNSFTFDRSHLDSLPQKVLGYRSKSRYAVAVPYDPTDEVLGDKSVYSTVEDLLKYVKAWTSDVLISEGSIEMAFTKTTLRNKREVDYGFGWRFKELSGNPVIYHNGLWHGFTSTITYVPDKDLTVIILNNTNSHVSGLAANIIRTAGEIF